MPSRSGLTALVLAAIAAAVVAPGAPVRAASREEATPETMKPYAGPSVRGVDTSTLAGKRSAKSRRALTRLYGFTGDRGPMYFFATTRWSHQTWLVPCSGCDM